MTILLTSAASIPAAIAKSATSATPHSTTFPAAAATSVGVADAFLSAPITTSPPYATVPDPAAPANPVIPNLNPKPLATTDPPPTSGIPPTVNCQQSGLGSNGCFPISLAPGGAVSNPQGLFAKDSSPFTVSPPDQGLCAGNGYVIESVNQGEMQVFHSDLTPASNVIALDSLMGLTAKGWSSGGDIMCQYDSGNGGHWFITQIVSATSDTPSVGGPFGGCFAAVPDTCYEGIAVSVTNDPAGSYFVYFLNANTVNNDPGSDAVPACYNDGAFCFTGILLNDYAKTATTRDSFLLFYDEFPLYGGFNGAMEFAFSKNALEIGQASVNFAFENMGNAPNLYPIPANGDYQPFALGGDAWYEVIPAQTTDPSQYDNSNGGTGYMITSLDFFGYGDNRVGVFDWTGLSNLNSAGCSTCGSIAFGGQLLTGGVTYQDEGAPCLVTDYYTVSTFCGLAPQKAGPVPLGDNCGLLSGETSPCPESGIATNGDGATEAFFANGVIWTAVHSVVVQDFNRGASELHIGATYWGVGAHGTASGVVFSLSTQGIVSANHEDIEFPTIAVGGRTVLMSFTLSGNGGPTGADSGGFFPSTAFLILSGSGQGVIHIADLGQAPQDGFTQYRGYTSGGVFNISPRWGDYGQAVFDATNGRIYFSTEFIQSAACSNSAFLADLTCGGTRAPAANWGTSVNYVSIP
jgi:hypothetical protein